MTRQSLPTRAPTFAACVVAVLVALLGGIALVCAPALALPEGRVYEMVSPVYKGGYGAHGITAVAPNGESVAFSSLGAFAGDPSNPAADNIYLARRGSSGWSTASLQQPASVLPRGGLIDYSATLESTLSEGGPGSSYFTSSYESTALEYLLHPTDAPDSAPNAPQPGPNFEVAGTAMETLTKKPGWSASYMSASPDFSHIVFSTGVGLELLPEAAKTESNLYDLTSHPVGGQPPLRLVGLNNKHKALEPECKVQLGAGTGRDSQFNAVADDGEEIFFTPADSALGECSRQEQVFVRIGGERTLEVSRPLEAAKPFGGCVAKGVHGEVPCEEALVRAPAQFQGASEDGSKVFFTTSAQLVPGDTDTSNQLYMASIGCPASEPHCEAAKREVTSLVQVSRDPNAGEAAEVQGVTVIAEDGSRVYFVARGVLAAGANAEGQAPIKGADNLYVYDSNESGSSPVFIGDLCSGPEVSGVAEDLRCPAGLSSGLATQAGEHNDTSLWTTHEPEAQTNSCSGENPACEPGRFIVFSTYAQLSAGDTDNAKDVYRYDALTGTLQRVSVGEDGYDANGNRDDSEIEVDGNRQLGGEADATIARNQEHHTVYGQHDMESRAITEDGSRIVFTTVESLSPQALNHLANVYEWHETPGSGEGSVSLVSTGNSTEPVTDVVISDTGNDIFFDSSQGLVPQDTDGQSDIYDARLDGGFPPPPSEPQPCEGDACQGPLTNPAPLLVPGSVSQAPGGNFAAPSTPVITKTTAKPKRATLKCPTGRKRDHGKCVKPKAKSKQRMKAKRSVRTSRDGRS